MNYMKLYVVTFGGGGNKALPFRPLNVGLLSFKFAKDQIFNITKFGSITIFPFRESPTPLTHARQ